jgi:hypothetical protein
MKKYKYITNLVNAALGDSDLEQRLTSLLQGHPPLWIR